MRWWISLNQLAEMLPGMLTSTLLHDCSASQTSQKTNLLAVDLLIETWIYTTATTTDSLLCIMQHLASCDSAHAVHWVTAALAAVLMQALTTYDAFCAYSWGYVFCGTSLVTRDMMVTGWYGLWHVCILHERFQCYWSLSVEVLVISACAKRE